MTDSMTTAETVTEDTYWSGCSDCTGHDGYVNLGRTHWFYCLTHKTKWIVGSNLLSTWQGETREDQRAAYDAVGLGEFAYVGPDAAAYEAHLATYNTSD